MDNEMSFEEIIDVLKQVKNKYTWCNYVNDGLEAAINILDYINEEEYYNGCD